MIDSLAVTTDFSRASREPFAAVGSLARKFGAKLYVLHVSECNSLYTDWQIPSAAPPTPWGGEKEIHRNLEKLILSEAAFRGLDVEPVVMTGTSADAVREFQIREQLDLVAIATHDCPETHRFRIGSFTSKVLRLVSCPTLVVRAPCDDAGEDAHLGELHPRRILVPCDFSKSSQAALQYGHLWANAFDTMVRLIFVVQEPAQLDEYGPELKKNFEKCAQWLRIEAAERLHDLATTDWSGNPMTVTVRTGDPGSEILKEAEEFGADLIIMGTLGLSASERLLLGSVSEKTIHGTGTPVLLTKQPE